MSDVILSLRPRGFLFGPPGAARSQAKDLDAVIQYSPTPAPPALSTPTATQVLRSPSPRWRSVRALLRMTVVKGWEHANLRDSLANGGICEGLLHATRAKPARVGHLLSLRGRPRRLWFNPLQFHSMRGLVSILVVCVLCRAASTLGSRWKLLRIRHRRSSL